MILIDTDVLIDCLRGFAGARAWLGSLPGDSFSIPGVVAMELLIGCRNQQELAQIQKFLGAFHVAWPDASEFERAFRLLLALHLSSGLGIPDCLIAAMALSRGARLYTFNLKHFQAVPGLVMSENWTDSPRAHVNASRRDCFAISRALLLSSGVDHETLGARAFPLSGVGSQTEPTSHGRCGTR